MEVGIMTSLRFERHHRSFSDLFCEHFAALIVLLFLSEGAFFGWLAQPAVERLSLPVDSRVLGAAGFGLAMLLWRLGAKIADAETEISCRSQAVPLTLIFIAIAATASVVVFAGFWGGVVRIGHLLFS
jgi:hypothetical protein